MLFFGFFLLATGLKGAKIPAAWAMESALLVAEIPEATLPESVGEETRDAAAFTMQICVPTVTGREFVPIGLGCMMRGSEG